MTHGVSESNSEFRGAIDAGRARTRLTITVALASVVGLAALWYTGWLGEDPGILFEAVLYPVLAWSLASADHLRADILSLPRRTRSLLLLLVGLAVTAQFVGGGGDVYPGVRWAMFSDEVTQVSGAAVIVTTSDGTSEVIQPATLFGSLRNGRGESLAARLDPDDLDDLLASYAARYGELNPGADVTRIDYVRLSASVEDDQLLIEPVDIHEFAVTP